MAKIFAHFAPGMVPYLGRSPSKPEGLRSFVTSGTYGLFAETATASLTLTEVSIDEVAPFLAFDYERFALASWESFVMSKAVVERFGSISWTLLKLYYSGFFAAHALMRFHGEGVLKLEDEQAEVLNSLSRIYRIERAFAPGMYDFCLEQQQISSFNLVFKPHKRGKGVHDSFWKTFASFLRRRRLLAERERAPDYQEFSRS